VARITDSRCVLAVRDLAASTRYYIDVLGFHREPIHGEGWSFLTRDSFKLMLGECPDERPAAELGNHSWFVYLYVDGIDQYYEEVAARGALVTSKPANKPWGVREFGMSTPDGHRITCGEPIATR
jgi:predicted enzyme related to lactoylglutathione lyase